MHALHVGHALIGDKRYGNNRINQNYRRQGLDRLFLHSRKLGFEWQGEAVQIDVPAEMDWEQGMEHLRNGGHARGGAR